MECYNTLMNLKTYAFIDASNLFYGGEKSLGWKIDYKKLFVYLQKKYGAKKILYFGGVEIESFKYDYLKNESVPLRSLEKYITDYIRRFGPKMDEAQLLLLSRHVKRIKFYLKLHEFGYKLFLKPVKIYHQENGNTQRKANCDVDLAFHLMKEIEMYERVLVLSGDGDFLPVLKHLRTVGKQVIVLSRGSRTAREMRQFAGNQFTDFVRLKKELKFES